jgi:signal transduction histidine kinase
MLLEPLLEPYILWFCRLRWIVLAIFLILGIGSFFPERLRGMGLEVNPTWVFAMAGVITVANSLFVLHAKRLTRLPARKEAKVNLWTQIIFDLLAVTAVVYFVGSEITGLGFVYLFHIVLACMFFSRSESVLVALLGSLLYLIRVLLEEYQVLPEATIFQPASSWQTAASPLPVWNTVATLSIFLVVWYLASHLSIMVRRAEARLADTNLRLLETQREKRRHMLRTTHELKAPFAAIHANAQLLEKGLCGPLAPEAQSVVKRISARARRLAIEIQEMLQLANLESPDIESMGWSDLDLADILGWCVSQVKQIADEHGVIVESSLRPARVGGVEDHLKMMFSNLLDNAVTYSHRGGKVTVACESEETGPIAVIEDHGIGIEEKKLTHIFDEYYRTEEAVAHNRESTGLGLAIVRQVCQQNGIMLRVESQAGVGTRFSLRFPSEPDGRV